MQSKCDITGQDYQTLTLTMLLPLIGNGRLFSALPRKLEVCVTVCSAGARGASPEAWSCAIALVDNPAIIGLRWEPKEAPKQ